MTTRQRGDSGTGGSSPVRRTLWLGEFCKLEERYCVAKPPTRTREPK